MVDCKHDRIYYTRHVRMIYKRVGNKKYTFINEDDESLWPSPHDQDFICSECGAVLTESELDFVDEEEEET